MRAHIRKEKPSAGGSGYFPDPGYTWQPGLVLMPLRVFRPDTREHMVYRNPAILNLRKAQEVRK